MSSNSKYTKNRNLWRKGYGPERRKPVTTNLVDQQTNVSYSLDLQKTFRDRNYFDIPGVSSGTQIYNPSALSLPTAQYDEGLVWFVNTTQSLGTFNFSFSGSPLVVLNLEPGYFPNVNIYGESITTSSLTIGASGPFSGSVRYRAIYSSLGFPALCSSSYTSSITASANYVDIVNADSYYGTFSYLQALPGVSGVYVSVWDQNNNNDADVYMPTYEAKASGLWQGHVDGTLSAKTTNRIHFIVTF